MFRPSAISFKAIAAGVFISVLMSQGWQYLFHLGLELPLFATSVVAELVAIIPGFIAGWVAGRQGLIHGLIVGLVCIAIVIVRMLLSHSAAGGDTVLSASLFLLSTASLITSSVSAIAGVGVKKYGFAF